MQILVIQGASLAGHEELLFAILVARVLRMEVDAFTKTPEGHTGSINYVVISPDGRTILSSSLDKTIRCAAVCRLCVAIRSLRLRAQLASSSLIPQLLAATTPCLRVCCAGCSRRHDLRSRLLARHMSGRAGALL